MQKRIQIIKRPSSNIQKTLYIKNIPQSQQIPMTNNTASRAVPTSTSIPLIPLGQYGQQISLHSHGLPYSNSLLNASLVDNKPVSVQMHQSAAIANHNHNHLQSRPQSPTRGFPYPNTKKIYFNYFSPENMRFQTRCIQTVVHSNFEKGKKQGQGLQNQHVNQWEQRYIQLEKQMNSFLLIHQKMTEQFVKIKQQLRMYNEMTLQNSIQSLTKTQSLLTQNHNQQLQQERQKSQSLAQKIHKLQQENTMFKQNSFRLQAMVEKLQTELISSYKIQSDKNQLSIQIKELEFQLKGSKGQNQELHAQKGKIEDQLYEVKMKLAQKNIQIQQLLSEKANKNQDKNKSNLTQEKFQQKLTRIRNEYQKKQKKFQKLLQSKVKQISDIRSYLLQLQTRQRNSKQLKQKYQKLYSQLKHQSSNLTQSLSQSLSPQSASLSPQAQSTILAYEQRIQQLNRIARQQNVKIETLQQQKSKLYKKIQQYQDNYVSQEQLAQLHRLVQEKNNRLLEKGGTIYDGFNNKVIEYENGQIFQQKLIYQLKKENQILVDLLRRAGIKGLGGTGGMQVVLNQNFSVNNQMQSGSDITMVMKTMISETFYKIQRITEILKETPNIRSEILIRDSKESSPIKSKRQKSPKKSKKKQQQPDKYLIGKISNDLQILKVYLVDLSSTCDRLVKKLQQQQHSISVKSKKQKQALESQVKIAQMSPKDQEILSYHKQKNKQLEQRIDQLLILNSTLKQKILERSFSDAEEKYRELEKYYKNQIEKLMGENREIVARYDRIVGDFEKGEAERMGLEEKCALYAIQLERLRIKMVQSQGYLEKIGFLETNIAQFNLNKTRYEREIAISKHCCEDLDSRLEEMSKLISSKDKQIRQLQTKLSQCNKSLSTLQLQSSQLSQKLSQSSQSTSSLQSQLSSLSSQLQSKQAAYLQTLSQLQSTKIQLQSITQKLQSQQSLLVLHQGSTDKIGSLQREIMRLKGENEDMRTKLEGKDRDWQREIIGWDRERDQMRRDREKIESDLRIEREGRQRAQREAEKFKQAEIGRQKNSNENAQVDLYVAEKIRSRILLGETLMNEFVQALNGRGMWKQIRNQNILNDIWSNYKELLILIQSLFSGASANSSSSNTQTSATLDQSYRQKMQNLQLKLSHLGQKNAYKLQMIRSLFIQIQCLVQEVEIQFQGKDKDRSTQINRVITEEIRKGLANLADWDLTFDIFQAL